ncbi:MBL fold metallo-hydrolase [Gordonia shandongensis]|uniref:MBL fold metallo-hydrolase n=1 Tax=Gordonia shandongensis TaxID=376351 RepID=UPI0004254286|nr:MBL fold metallo-hydrolase [Gordonia shandongensis]
MRIRHLNCGTLRPIGTAAMVCHVLLLESDDGLTLVDTGFGLRDVADPRGRLGRSLITAVRPDLDESETAIAQIAALGFEPRDVTDIVMTHLDSDHSGGIDDFPAARLHVNARELADADAQPGPSPAVRYRPWRRSTRPAHVQSYDRFPDSWFGLPATTLATHGDDLAFVTLPGHTSGHMGVAVRDGDGWLLHCGDAFYHRGGVSGGGVAMTMRFAQAASARHPRIARQTRRRLADLHDHASDTVRLVCAHDAVQYDRARG